MASNTAILKELKKRAKDLQEKKKIPTFSFDKYCFKNQTSFFRGKGPRFRTAVCSRRAGKTVGIAADALDTCNKEKKVLLLYITITKQNARNIIWGDIKNIVEAYKMPYKLDDLRLEATNTKTGSKFIIAGAKDRSEIEKYRGWKLRKCYIDECQSFRSYIKDLIFDIITPALRDHRGELYLTGTPGPVKAGVFYEFSQSDLWDNHKWTAFDNPHMHNPDKGKDLEVVLEEERTMKQIPADDPGYIRETYGEWVEDLDSLVFKFNDGKNVYKTLPDRKYNYIFGIDIGYNDSDAIGVLAFDNEHKQVFLVEELVKNKQNITELVKNIKLLKEKYDPIKMVMDAGALGKKIQEEIHMRHGLDIEAAEKTRKVEFIALLNDDLKTGKLRCFNGSIFREDCMLVQWDKESIIKNPENPKISKVYHSDICDAVLYAWRACLHYISSPAPKEPKRNTNEYMLRLEEEEAQRMRDKDNPFNDLLTQEEIEDYFNDI